MKMLPLYKKSKFIDYFDSLADVENWLSEFGKGEYTLYSFVPYWGWGVRKHRHPQGVKIAILRCT